jgi:hypothetical protein
MHRLLPFGMRAARIALALWAIHSSLYTVHILYALSTLPPNVLAQLPVAHASVTYVLPIIKYVSEPIKHAIEHITVNGFTNTIKAYCVSSWRCEILPAVAHSWDPRRIKCKRDEDVGLCRLALALACALLHAWTAWQWAGDIVNVGQGDSPYGAGEVYRGLLEHKDVEPKPELGGPGVSSASIAGRGSLMVLEETVSPAALMARDNMPPSGLT